MLHLSSGHCNTLLQVDAPDKCLMDTAALTRQPPPLPLMSFFTRAQQGGHLLPGRAALRPLWKWTCKEL